MPLAGLAVIRDNTPKITTVRFGIYPALLLKSNGSSFWVSRDVVLASLERWQSRASKARSANRSRIEADQVDGKVRRSSHAKVCSPQLRLSHGCSSERPIFQKSQPALMMMRLLYPEAPVVITISDFLIMILSCLHSRMCYSGSIPC